MKYEAARVIEEIIHLLSNDSCLHDYENAGELTYYLDMSQTQDKPKIRLMKSSDSGYGQTFTLDNAYNFQFGYVMTRASPEGGTAQEFGGLYQNTNVGTAWDLLIFINDTTTVFDPVNHVIPAFNKVGVELLDMEVNPVQVIMRNGMMSQKDLLAYPPFLRAFAYTFKIPIYPEDKITFITKPTLF